jgi:hypothetical protein
VARPRLKGEFVGFLVRFKKPLHEKLREQSEFYSLSINELLNFIVEEWMLRDPPTEPKPLETVRPPSVDRKSVMAEGELSTDDWLRILDTWGGRCAYCREEADSLSKDHLIPLTKGGRHRPENIVPSCPSCNSSKCNYLVIVGSPLSPRAGFQYLCERCFRPGDARRDVPTQTKPHRYQKRWDYPLGWVSRDGVLLCPDCS